MSSVFTPVTAAAAAAVPTTTSVSTVATAAAAAATIANHFSQARIDLLLGLLEHTHKVTSLLGI